MTCQTCGESNAATAKFCSSCGTPLAAACPNCGASYAPGARFCSECGTPLTAAAGPRPEPTPERGGELRQVTVLFCDLVGYTSLSEDRDAEDMRELLSTYFDTARRIVDRYGGVVEKFIGDAVMAVWGTPVAREDDAERAVRAGLDLVEEVARFGDASGLTGLQARAGVVTGQAAAWASAGEGLVVGDRVNTAARVQAAAEPGMVYVDDVTKQVTVASVSYSDAGVHELKGKAEPLQLWRAVRIVAGKGGAQRIDGLEAAFVGRARELNLVKELFHATVEDGRARLVSVTGQAGVGKSRLRWEFDKYVDGLAFDVYWHSGRCLSYGEGVAYWALSEMVRQRMGVAEEDPNDVAATKLAAGLDKYFTDPSVRDYLRPALGVLMGVTQAALTREELFAGWRMFLEQLAVIRPVVLVFEDMQWADQGLLDFLEHLLDWSASSPIFVLSFARPELMERRQDWLVGRRNATPLYLEALPRAALDELLQDLVPGVPADVADKIATRAAGIPLYAVEMVRGLIDRDIVVPQEGVYRLVGTVDDIHLPASLTALIGARLDALSPDERTAVRTMSVLGSTFPPASVRAVTDLPEAEVDAVLQSLLRKEILTVHSDPLSPDRGQYAFVQSLMRTVAYDTLAKRDRRALHERVAQHLRSVFPDDGEDVVEVIASHYRDAFAAGGDDADSVRLRDEARQMFIRAARRAAAVGAPGNAEQAYRVACELAVDEQEQAELTTQAGHMAFLAGHYPTAFDLFSAAQQGHRGAGRERAALLLSVPMSRAVSRSGRLSEGVALLKSALQKMSDDEPAMTRVVAALARSMSFMGELEEAGALTERALVLAQDFEDEEALTESLAIKALLMAIRNRVPEAIILFRGALDLLGDDGPVDQRINAHHNTADLLQQSDLPGAEEHLEAVMSLAKRTGDRGALAFATGNLMGHLLFKGDWDEVARLGDSILATGNPVAEDAAVHTQISALAAMRGQAEAAAQHLTQIAHLADSDDVQDRTLYSSNQAFAALSDDRWAEAMEVGTNTVHLVLAGLGVRTEPFRLAWPTAAEAALRVGDVDAADALLELLSSRPIGHIPPYLRAQLARLGGLAAAARGSHATVEADLRRAAESFDDLGYPYWQAVALTDLAQWLTGQQRGPEAAPLLHAADQVFGRLGAAPQAQRVASLQSPAPATLPVTGA